VNVKYCVCGNSDFVSVWLCIVRENQCSCELVRYRMSNEQEVSKVSACICDVNGNCGWLCVNCGWTYLLFAFSQVQGTVERHLILIVRKDESWCRRRRCCWSSSRLSWLPLSLLLSSWFFFLGLLLLRLLKGNARINACTMHDQMILDVCCFVVSLIVCCVIICDHACLVPKETGTPSNPLRIRSHLEIRQGRPTTCWCYHNGNADVDVDVDVELHSWLTCLIWIEIIGCRVDRCELLFDVPSELESEPEPDFLELLIMSAAAAAESYS